MTTFVRRIVAPVDFSETSDHALRTVCAYAVEMRAEVSLVHVLMTTEYVMGSGIFLWTQEMMDEARAAAKKVVEERAVIFRDAHVDYRSTVLDGIPEAEIVRFATAEHADLIVMGTHGRTGLARIAMGSVAERVVSHAPCPVLLVRLPKEPTNQK